VTAVRPLYTHESPREVDQVPSSVRHTTSMKMSDELYSTRLGRSATEKQRMNEQFDLLSNAMGWVLHPSIRSNLTPTAAIADIATGTGECLVRLSKDYPHGRLDGYDFSSAMFPPTESLPSNVRLNTADAKKPFSKDLYGIYDLVHVRYLTAAMAPDDWATVLNNALQLLKPGGYIQWVEPNLTQQMWYRSEPHSTVTSVARIFQIFMKNPVAERIRYGWSTLGSLMEKRGLTVTTDIATSDRVAKDRRALSENGSIVAFAFVRGLAAKGALDGMTIEDYDTLEQKARADIESGAFIRYDLYTVVGRKPLTELVNGVH